MNGLVEVIWQILRKISFALLNEGRAGEAYFDMSLEHSWKVFNVLPLKTLTLDDRTTTPFELFYGQKPNIRRFRVLFCPCIVKTHVATTSSTV
jgi:hypothetical protein